MPSNIRDTAMALFMELDNINHRAIMEKKGIRKEIKTITEKALKETFPNKEIDFSISDFWSCNTSPIGFCIYDTDEDPAHDHCLFCGDPEERK